MNYLRRHTRRHSKRLYWEGEAGWRAAGWGNPGRPLCQCLPGFNADGMSSQIVSGQSLCLRVLPGGTCITQPWIPGRVLGGGRDAGASSWLFLSSSGWWWLVSSMFLTRPSCHKVTQENSYCCACLVGCPSVFPPTTPCSTKIVTIITMCNLPVKVCSKWGLKACESSPHFICLIRWKTSLRILNKYSPLFSRLGTTKKAVLFPWGSLVMRSPHRFLSISRDIFLECNQISPLWQNIARCLHHLLIIRSIVFIITFLS